MSVAVAGGSSGVGRAIVEAILARGGHRVVILTRKELQRSDAESAVVDYSDPDSLTVALEKHSIHTVISAVSNVGGNNSSEVNLIRAAERSATTVRFIPSYFGVPYTAEQYRSFAPAMAKKAALDELEPSSLEWTTVFNGFFMDYFGTPKVQSFIDDIAFFIDMPNNVAVVPGSGETPVVFTHTNDVAKFVDAALDLPEWPRELYIVGDRLTWHEMVKVAEEVKGTKFQVTHDSVEKLESGQVTGLPSHEKFYHIYPKEHLHSFISGFGLECERGQADFRPDQTLNDLFPDIKAKTVREVMSLGWGGD